LVFHRFGVHCRAVVPSEHMFILTPFKGCKLTAVTDGGENASEGDWIDERAVGHGTQLWQQRRSLELGWAYQTRDRRAPPVVCRVCRGSGSVPCRFCHGTGVMALGDRLACSVTARNCDCYACRARGQQRCTRCAGSGFIASWLAPLEELP
jgi:hypothetical protein